MAKRNSHSESTKDKKEMEGEKKKSFEKARV